MANASRLRVILKASLLLGGLVLAQAPNAGVVTEPLSWLSSSVEAGLERLKAELLETSIDRDLEFVGAVLKAADGTFRFTQGSGRSGQDRVAFRIRRPGDAELVGLWHTHGAHGATRGIFSATDAELVRALNLPFYLITPDGEIRVLRPEHLTRSAPAPTPIRGRIGRLPRGAHAGESVGDPAQDVIEV